MNKYLSCACIALLASAAHAEYQISTQYTGSATVTISGECKKTLKFDNASYGHIENTENSQYFYGILANQTLLHTETSWSKNTFKKTSKASSSQYSLALDTATLHTLIADTCAEMRLPTRETQNSQIYFDNVKASDKYDDSNTLSKYTFKASANFYTLKPSTDVQQSYKATKNTIKISFSGTGSSL